MPIKIDDSLPASETLQSENIFVMSEARAYQQDIRPLRIALLNLMPTKISTETQILRLLGNSPLQVDIVLISPLTYQPKNTPQTHLLKFYKHFDEIKHDKFDGLIITGAPVEEMDFEEVLYWEELTQIMEWSKRSVFSTFHICWGAQAGLYYHYGINKWRMDKKLFGVFEHTCNRKHSRLLRGFDDAFYAPHSRYTDIDRIALEQVPQLEVLAESRDAGIYIVASMDGKQIFVTGHSEYDPLTLADEYFRDVDRGLNPDMPRNYFCGDNPKANTIVKWRGHANLLYSNWLNYYVYQETPYDIEQI